MTVSDRFAGGEPMPSPPGHAWFTVRDICARFRVSRTTVWSWVARDLLPKPHHLRQRALWRADEIAEAEARLITPPPRAA